MAAFERISKWAKALFADGRCPELAKLVATRTWKELAHAISFDLGTMTNHDVKTNDSEEALKDAHFQASIPITFPTERAEIHVKVGLGKESLVKLCSLMMGESNPSPELMNDLLREFANTAGGAMKRSADAEGFMATMGLPKLIEVPALDVGDPANRCRFAVTSNDFSIGMEVTAHSRKLEQVVVSKLKEGMVVAADVANSAGALLVRAGTRLTLSNVTRLAGLLPAKAVIEVADAA